MKITIRRDNLNEARNLLREFTKADQASLMEIEDQFTVSYEIELESKSSMFSGGQGESAEDKYQEDKDQARIDIERGVRDGSIEDNWSEWDSIVNDGSHDEPILNIVEHFIDDQQLDLSTDTFLAPFCVFLIGAEILSSNFASFSDRFVDKAKTHGASLIIKLFREFPEINERLKSCANLAANRILGEALRNLNTDSVKIEPHEFADYLLTLKLPAEIIPMNKQYEILLEAFEIFISGYYINRLFDSQTNRKLFGYQLQYVDFAEPSFETICKDLNLSADYEQLYNRGVSFLNLIADGGQSLADVASEMRRFGPFVRDSILLTGITKKISSYVIGSIEDTIENYVDEFMYQWERDNPLDDYYDQYGFGFSGDKDELPEVYENKVSEYLPRFYRRFGSELKFEPDGSLDNETGLEFSMNTYLEGLQEAMEFLELFFSDYDSQDFFFMSKKTGMHMNIGHKSVGGGESKDFNLIKGFLFLSEDVDQVWKALGTGRQPRAKKGLQPSRVGSRWANPLAPTNKPYELSQEAKSRFMADFVNSSLTNTYNQGITSRTRSIFTKRYESGKFDFSDLTNNFLASFKDDTDSELEGLFSKILFDGAVNIGPKNIGFNINYTRGKSGDDDIKYVEFRFPGHEMTLETAKDLTMYYAYIIRHMVDKSYMKEEYAKKFVALLSRTAEASLPSLSLSEQIIKVGNPVSIDIGNAEAYYLLQQYQDLLYTLPESSLYFQFPESDQETAQTVRAVSFANPGAYTAFAFALADLKKMPITNHEQLFNVQHEVPAAIGNSKFAYPCVITKVEGEGLSARMTLESLVLSINPERDKSENWSIANPDYSPVIIKKVSVTTTGASLMGSYWNNRMMTSLYPVNKEDRQSSLSKESSNYKKMGNFIKRVIDHVGSSSGPVMVKPTKAG